MRFLSFVLSVVGVIVLLVACFPSRPIELSVSVSVSPSELSEGATAVITVTAAPEPVDQITVSVDGRNIGSSNGSSATFVWVAKGVGEHTVEAHAFSSVYGEGKSRTFVKVDDATPPTVTSIGVMPSVPRPSEPFSILVEASDPESPYLDITFRSGAVTKSQRFTSPPYVLEIDGLPEGMNPYTVSVVNDSGMSSYVEGEIVVSPPDTSPPRISLSLPDFVREGEALRANVTVEDDLSLSSVRVSFDASTVETANLSIGERVWSKGFEWSVLESGTHFLSVTAVDLYGNAVSTTTSVVVRSASSVEVALTVDRKDALPGETVSFSVMLEGGTPTLVEFYVDDELAQSGTSTGFLWNVEPGRHLIGVRVVSNGMDAHDAMIYEARDVAPPTVETRYQGIVLSPTDRTEVPVVPNGVVVVKAHDVSGVKVDSPLALEVQKYEMGTYVKVGETQLYLQSLSADTQTATFVGVLNYEIEEEVILRLVDVSDVKGNSITLDYPVTP